MPYSPQAFREMDVGIFIISALSTHIIQRCSKSFEVLTGYTLAEMQKMKMDFYRMILHPEDFPNVLAAQKKFEADRFSCYFGHCRIRSKNEMEWKWFNGFATPYTYDPHGNVKEVFCNFHPLWQLSDTPAQTEEAICQMLQALHQAEIRFLSKKERQVLSLALMGDNEKMIAGKLRITVRTVEMHLASLRGKLKVPNMAALVAKAKDMGL